MKQALLISLMFTILSSACKRNKDEEPQPTTPTIDTVLGCMDPNAWNYDPAANVDDGKCDYDSINYFLGQFRVVFTKAEYGQSNDCFNYTWSDQTVDTNWRDAEAIRDTAHPGWIIMKGFAWFESNIITVQRYKNLAMGSNMNFDCSFTSISRDTIQIANYSRPGYPVVPPCPKFRAFGIAVRKK